MIVVPAKIGVHSNLEVTAWNASTPGLEVLAKYDRGLVLHRRRYPNLVVNAGLNLLRDLLDTRTKHSVNGITHIMLGTGTNPVDAGDLGLAAEVWREPIAQSVKGSQQVSFKYFLGTGQLNGTTITEAGLSNNATLHGQPMFARRLLDEPIEKVVDIAVTFVWTVGFTAL
jgi:hypothetical protein